MLELMLQTLQSHQQVKGQELVNNHEQLQMEVVQTINKEISSVVTNTVAVVNFSKNSFSPTSPLQSKFSSAPKDSHISNVSKRTMFFNPVLATRQAHHMQQDILPESTTLNMSTPTNSKVQFFSVGNALCYGGRVLSDFKAFAIHLPFAPF